MNEYSEAAKKILPKFVSSKKISEQQAKDILDYILYLEQQEQSN